MRAGLWISRRCCVHCSTILSFTGPVVKAPVDTIPGYTGIRPHSASATRSASSSSAWTPTSPASLSLPAGLPSGKMDAYDSRQTAASLCWDAGVVPVGSRGDADRRIARKSAYRGVDLGRPYREQRAMRLMPVQR
jgi:hypothetical protein